MIICIKSYEQTMISVSQLLTDAWTLYKENFNKLIIVGLVPAIATLIAWSGSNMEVRGEFMFPTLPFGTLILVITAALMSIVGGMALIKVLMNPKEISVTDAYSFALSKFFPYIWVCILVGAVVTAGFILLIIPGIIACVYFALSTFVLIGEDVRGVAALKKSYAYVDGRWSRVFVRILALIAGVIVVSFILSFFFGNEKAIFHIGDLIFSLIVTPFVTAYLYLLYVDLKKTLTSTAPVLAQPDAVTPTTAPVPTTI